MRKKCADMFYDCKIVTQDHFCLNARQKLYVGALDLASQQILIYSSEHVSTHFKNGKFS